MNMQQQKLNLLFNRLNRLIETASNMRGLSGASTMHYKILGIEDSIVEVKIENQNNNYYFIDINKPSKSTAMINKEKREYKEYVNFCNALKKAEKTNSILFRFSFVKVISEKISDHVWHYKERVYKVKLLDGTTSDWYGNNAKDALNNCAPFTKKVITSIELLAA